jgi:hypothetical protein
MFIGKDPAYETGGVPIASVRDLFAVTLDRLAAVHVIEPAVQGMPLARQGAQQDLLMVAQEIDVLRVPEGPRPAEEETLFIKKRKMRMG